MGNCLSKIIECFRKQDVSIKSPKIQLPVAEKDKKYNIVQRQQTIIDEQIKYQNKEAIIIKGIQQQRYPRQESNNFLEQQEYNQRKKQQFIIRDYEYRKKGDQKYIYIQTWQQSNTRQIYLCQSRYDSSKKIKKIFKRMSPQVINSFLSYYRGVKNLNHPNMLKYDDVYQEDQNFIIVTEYVEGKCLNKIIETKSREMSEESKLIQEKKILKFYTQIQSLLKYLQGKKIEHNHICPAHIIISKFDKPILMQFTPRHHSEFFLSEQSTPYKIPQQFLKRQQSSTDRWSLAMILIELYFNKKITQLIKNPYDPFEDLQKVIKNIKNTQIKHIIQQIVFFQKQKQEKLLETVIIQQQFFINERLKIRQKIIQSSKNIQFKPIVYSKQTNQEIKIQKSTNFTESFIDLVNTKNQVTNHIIYDTYQRCKQLVDPVQSKSVQYTFQKQNKTQPHPLLILGSVLRSDNKTVHYSKKSTPLSIMSSILLALQIGMQERKIRSVVNYAISQKKFNDANNTGKIKQQILNILKKHYNTQQSNPIITKIEWSTKQKIIVQYYYPQNKSSYSNNLRGGDNVSEISTETLVDALQLSPSDLDSRGDINFVDGHVAEMQMRGGLPYFQPNGWVRYGLNVSKFTQLDGNDKWLRMDGNDGEWAVYFHGLGNNGDGDQVKKVAKIIIQTQFKAGQGQVHQNRKLFVPKDLYNRLSKNPKALEQYKKEKQVGRGIYGSPLINEVCLGFTAGTQFGNQSYRVAFQCRIHPEKVYMSDSIKSYWVVRDPKYIRPYGLLIGKLSDFEKQKNITNQFSLKYSQFQRTNVSF